MTKILYYNPNIAAHATTHHRPGMERFSKFFRIFNPSVVFIDRTNTIKIPIKTTSLFPMPALRPQKKTYEDICNERAIELLARADKLGVRLYTMWSGGIDSTLLLISFLKNATPAQRDNITVLLTEESIAEYPEFYRDHIYGKLAMDSSGLFPTLLGGKNLLVGGEHNDQLFGSDMVAHLILKFGPGIINTPYNRDNFFVFFNEKLNDAETTNFYLDIFERLRAAAPIEIRTHFDFLWWINFSVKWQSVFMRMLAYTPARNAPKVTREYINERYVHFYGTEDFQLWSMNNMDKKIKDTWETYKWTAKDVIFDYTKDVEYRDHKTKRGSLYFLLVQQDSFHFIDETMHFSKELPLEEYYNADNDFN